MNNEYIGRRLPGNYGFLRNLTRTEVNSLDSVLGQSKTFSIIVRAYWYLK